MILVVGLGNYDSCYRNTRHNIGHLFFEWEREKSNAGINIVRDDSVVPIKETANEFTQKFMGKCDGNTDNVAAEYFEKNYKKIQAVFARPMTGMNESGVGTKILYNSLKEKYDLENILAVVDELDIPFPRIRIGKMKRLTHKGAASMNEHIPGVSFIRVGIGKPTVGKTLDHVLGNFERWETEKLPGVFEAIDNIIQTVAVYGLEKASSLYNSRNSK